MPWHRGSWFLLRAFGSYCNHQTLSFLGSRAERSGREVSAGVSVADAQRWGALQVLIDACDAAGSLIPFINGHLGYAGPLGLCWGPGGGSLQRRVILCIAHGDGGSAQLPSSGSTSGVCPTIWFHLSGRLGDIASPVTGWEQRGEAQRSPCSWRAGQCF